MVPPPPPPGAQTPPVKPAPSVALFDQVWRTVDGQFYNQSFHGIDWRVMRTKHRPQAKKAKTRAALFAVVNKMIGESCSRLVFSNRNVFHFFGNQTGLGLVKLRNFFRWLGLSKHCVDDLFADTWKKLKFNSLMRGAGFTKRSVVGITEAVFLLMLQTRTWSHRPVLMLSCHGGEA